MNDSNGVVNIDPDFFQKLANSFPRLDQEPVKTETEELISKITAVSYIAGNLKTGKIYFEKRADISLPVASMSKLLTASVAQDLVSSETETVITEEMINTLPQNKDDFVKGEKFSISELIPIMLVSSSNIAAEAIASTSAMNRDLFVTNMSSYSWEVGVRSSYFYDPSGISELNRVSARDIFELSKYLYERKPQILAITKTAKGFLEANSKHNAHRYESTHPYVNDRRFMGGKTGTTLAAGETMLTVLNIKGEPISITVLHSKQTMRKADTEILAKLVSNILEANF
jgi:D-alanyl-D-alanine carboxypeptidase